MSDRFTINSDDVYIGRLERPTFINSINETRLKINADLVDGVDNILSYSSVENKIKFEKGIDFNNLPYINLPSGAPVEIPANLEVETIELNETGVNEPNLILNKNSLIFTNDATSSIGFYNPTTAHNTSIYKTGGVDDLVIGAGAGDVLNLRLQGSDGRIPLLKFNSNQINTSNLSDVATILNTTATAQQKEGAYAVGQDNNKCTLQDSKLSIHNVANNGTIAFSTVDGTDKIKLEHNFSSGNLDIIGGTGITTNLNLQSNGTHQPKIQLSGFDMSVSDLEDYNLVLQTTGNQTISSGIKTFDTVPVFNGGCNFVSSNNNISASGNILNVDAGNELRFLTGGNEIMSMNNDNIFLNKTNVANKKCFYKGSTASEEILNSSEISTLATTVAGTVVSSALSSDPTAVIVKQNLIQGGYGGTADFSTTFKNDITMSEFQHSFNGTTWSPTAAPLVFNVNCNLGISDTKDIQRGALNLFEIITKMITSYRVDGSFAVSNGSTTPIDIITQSTAFSTFINNVNTNNATIQVPQGLYKAQIVFNSDLGDRSAGYYNSLRGSFDFNCAFPVNPPTNDTLPELTMPVSWVCHATTMTSFPEIKFIMNLSGSYRISILVPSGIATQATNNFRLKLNHISDYPINAI